MLLKTGTRYLSLIRQIASCPGTGWPGYLRRCALLILLLPPFVLLQILHWVGFAVDEVLFRRYRRVPVLAPFFVVGVPRSGTTFLHRLLAADNRFTTFSTWECLFAPSISERYLWAGLARVDRVFGRPLSRLMESGERWLMNQSAAIHPTGLRAPEEDYLCFLPLLCCFILILPFPNADWVWRMARFDVSMPEAERRWLLRWYRRCLQKHLYFHGQDRTLLSKNASFAGMVGSLASEFPDGRFVVCHRDAAEVIASQFRSLEPGMRLFGIGPDDAAFRRRLVDCLDFYYSNLDRVMSALPQRRFAKVPLDEISRSTNRAIERLYSHFGLAPSPLVDAAIAAYLTEPACQPVTRLSQLPDFGLDAAEIDRRFARWRSA